MSLFQHYSEQKVPWITGYGRQHCSPSLCSHTPSEPKKSLIFHLSTLVDHVNGGMWTEHFLPLGSDSWMTTESMSQARPPCSRAADTEAEGLIKKQFFSCHNLQRGRLRQTKTADILFQNATHQTMMSLLHQQLICWIYANEAFVCSPTTHLSTSFNSDQEYESEASCLLSLNTVLRFAQRRSSRARRVFPFTKPQLFC